MGRATGKRAGAGKGPPPPSRRGTGAPTTKIRGLNHSRARPDDGDDNDGGLDFIMDSRHNNANDDDDDDDADEVFDLDGEEEDDDDDEEDEDDDGDDDDDDEVRVLLQPLRASLERTEGMIKKSMKWTFQMITNDLSHLLTMIDLYCRSK